VKTEREVGHGRTKLLAGDASVVDRRRRRKNAGKKRVQRAAIIGVIACAGVGMRASVVTMAVSVPVGMVSTGLVMSGVRNGSAGSRMRW
jgi:hypothetical protein